MDMISKLIVISVLLGVIRAHGIGHGTCDRFREAFVEICSDGLPESPRIQGPPGKIGPQGIKGELGAEGPRGPPAIVDYDVINTEVTRQVDIALADITAKMDNMKVKLDRLARADKSLCPVFYKERCFRLLVESFTAERVSHQEAKEMCDNIGWKLANVYDLTHFEMIEEYMRSRTTSSTTDLNAWIGMTWNVQSRQAYYTDGEAASLSGIQWYRTFPRPTASYTNMGVYFRNDVSHTDQGIYNFPPGANRHGAFCELQ